MTLNKNIKKLSVFTVIIISLLMITSGTTNADVIETYYTQIRFPHPYTVYHDAELISFEYAEQNLGASSGARGYSKVEMADILVTRNVDDFSPLLFITCAEGSHYDEVIITVSDPGAEEVLKIKLGDVTVTSYSFIAESDVDAPKESFTLGYSVIQYFVGQIDRTWDLDKNKQI